LHVALQLVQVPALQMPFVPVHELHPAPPDPHAVCTLPGMQVEPLQHPPQVLGSQTHAPFEQRWPVEQAGPPPHVHAPWPEHPSPVTLPLDDTHAWHAPPPAPHAGPVVGDWHVPLAVQHPFEQDVASQTQLPLTQR
jgi:hypothetical protein